MLRFLVSLLLSVARFSATCLATFYNIAIKTAQTVSITLPPEMLKRAHALARRESRTMSELVCEALRHYERRSWWDEVNRYGQEKAAALGIGPSEWSGW